MDVLIKNMEKPKSCEYIDDDGCARVCFMYSHCENCFDDCPLVELPPHGRLGDLDDLADHIRNAYCKDCKRSKVMCKACEYGDMLDEIEEAPTVLEASK